MQYDVDQAIEILSRTPVVLQSLLGGLDDQWVQARYGENTFSPFDVVGHLIQGERKDWIPRARIILEHGESRPFEPFDRFAMFKASEGKTIDQLLSEFATLRKQNVEVLRELQLTPEKLALRGKHPEFGSVKLEAHLATWVVHDLSHIAQIMRAMGHQYREAVGPWAKYLRIVNN
jgi:hypothetical protein